MHHTSAFHHGVLPIVPPFVFLPLSLQLAMLFLNRDVQSISMRFGHVIVLLGRLPCRGRAVAGRADLRAGRRHLSGRRRECRGVRRGGQRLRLRQPSGSPDVRGPRHRGARGEPCGRRSAQERGTAIRHEEGAAFLCEAWYLLGVGGDAQTATTPVIADAAADLRTRAAAGRPVRATATQVNAVRAEMARTYGYENGFYGNDG